MGMNFKIIPTALSEIIDIISYIYKFNLSVIWNDLTATLLIAKKI